MKKSQLRSCTLQRFTYHVFQRGRSGSPCFTDDASFAYYLRHLYSCLRAYRQQLHTYVLLPNEQHLLITPFSGEGIGTMLRAVNDSYNRYFRGRFNRSSPLAENSCQWCLLQGGNLVLDCQKYIELVPVRKRLVTMPGEYPWSGYGANAFGDHGQNLVPHRQYQRLRSPGGSSLQRYRDFIQAGFNAGQYQYLDRYLKLEHSPGTRARQSARRQAA
jgi:putative transposase